VRGNCRQHRYNIYVNTLTNADCSKDPMSMRLQLAISALAGRGLFGIGEHRCA
jgi:hypothetical protein